jgi:hypothetical protein
MLDSFYALTGVVTGSTALRFCGDPPNDGVGIAGTFRSGG